MAASDSAMGPLTRLSVSGFTVFDEHDFRFSPGLNVIAGENGAGKSHLLRLAYASTKALYPSKARHNAETKEALSKLIADKLVSVFLPDNLGRLCRRAMGRQRSDVWAYFGSENDDEALHYSFATNSTSAVRIDSLPPVLPLSPTGGPIFFPTREVLTIHPQFIKLVEEYYVGIDETSYDLCRALLGGPKMGKRTAATRAMLEPLEEAMGGHMVTDSGGRFYLKPWNGGNLEIPLVAEGIRKIATLAWLVLNGALAKHSTVYWDEPETNLNPRLIATLAKALVALAAAGVQVFVATHSLFLMKEISYLLSTADKRVPAKFFSLVRHDDGVEVQTGKDIDDLKTVVAFDATVEQDDKMEDLYWEGRR